ncbi:hypothetical protein [Streptomyces chartreusis]|uniref:Uncharacterized protein n=1 Tax=Streptomyces chartreusis TaxID=1969 RepID=A0A7H8TAT4_STRCX|nr:hypothetical protein [Streptomyces chartreusis]QKZ20082.1 hypothetical protein HUT05_23615 [Streptomyces chartreusis]
MTSWLGAVRGRTRAASSRPRALSWPAGTLTVLVAGLAVGLPGAGVSYGLDEPHGAVPTGSSSGSAALSWSSLLSGASGAPSWPAGSPPAASGASPGSAGGSGTEPSAVPPPQDEKPSATAPSPSGTSEESAEETPEETEASDESVGRSEKPRKRPRESSTPTAHGPAASSPDPSDRPSRAGSRAGEGRQRPGREKGPLEEQEVARDKRDGDKRADERDGSRTPDAEREGEDDGDIEPESSDTADAPAQDTAPSATPTRHARPPAPHAAEPVLEVLPLGAGLVLIGLGLGLAFVGLRLRRG